MKYGAELPERSPPPSIEGMHGQRPFTLAPGAPAAVSRFERETHALIRSQPHAPRGVNFSLIRSLKLA